MYECAYKYTHTHTHTHIHTHIYKHIYKHTFTHTHTYLFMSIHTPRPERHQQTSRCPFAPFESRDFRALGALLENASPTCHPDSCGNVIYTHTSIRTNTCTRTHLIWENIMSTKPGSRAQSAATHCNAPTYTCTYTHTHTLTHTSDQRGNQGD